MALNKAGLQATILQILTDMESRTSDAKVEFSQRLAGAIDVFVKSGTVTTTVASGIAVSTAGTATAQTGATTATGSGMGAVS